MNTATWRIRISLFCVVGLLAWAGVSSDARLAWAQSQERCPPPADATPVEPPDVTAQQVESGTGSLMDFALSVRERFLEQAALATTPGQSQYFACLIRQDESAWRSGSTYLVTLTHDGRVFVHAKDMSLSGRQLRPSIYGGILRALGINPADLADPAAARAAFAAAMAGNGGSFDIPGVPGASGYASVYTSLSFRTPAFLLAGFDLDATHLAAEQIDYGDPAITAADVVDRATLKAFVTEAGTYFMRLVLTGDPAAVSKARIAMRDPNGPWRHGSVYLYVWNLTSRTILFHAGFPDTYELQPLVPVARDAVTGEFILPHLIEAAESGPEGGFHEYHFDDPTDDTDSVDIPKVGYVRTFSNQVQRADGSTRQISFVVGSGFYGSASQEVAEGGNAVIESVLPRVMRAMTASTVDTVSGRIERATSGIAPDAAFSFGGASTLSDALLANGHALENGTFELDRLLANSSFTVRLNAADNGSAGPFGNLAFWGSGDYRSIAGGDPQAVGYDGSVLSASLGIDTKLGDDMLAGLAVSQAQGTVDYTASSTSGELTTSLTSVNPYMGWQMAGGLNLWAMAGFGTGEVELDDEAADAQASDLTQRMIAAGVNGTLMSSDEMIAGGTTNLNLKGEVAFTSTDVDGSGSLESMSLSASRQRLVLEGEHVQKLDSGATFTPSLELGLRNDGGDGETGTGIEAGGALRYADAESGLTVEGRVRTLLNHSGDYEETGVSGLVRIDPGASGQGLALSVEPAWGRTASGVRQLWENGVTAGTSPADQAVARLNAEIGYGLGAAHGLALVTPYTGLGLAGDGAQWWRVGARWQLAPAASVSVEGNLYEAAKNDEPAHGLMLRGALRW